MTEEIKIDGRTREGRAAKAHETEAPSKRAEQVRTQRRRRSDNLGARKNLALTAVDLDRENYAYRIVNDDEARLHRMTVQDDWDICLKDGTGTTFDNATDEELGSAHSIIVGAKKDGSPKRAYLCRKPLDLHRQDRLAKQRRLDELDDAIRGGGFDPKGEIGSDGGNFYNPGDRRNTVR